MNLASIVPNNHNYKFDNTRSSSRVIYVFKFILFLLLLLCTLISLPSPVYPNTKSPFIIPLGGEIITVFRQSYWDLDKQKYLKHTGIDIKGKYGQKVAAAGNGVVSYCGFSPVGGRTVVIKHNQKIRTTYLNLMHIYVSPGTYVKQGEIIATIGADDDPSNPQCHLHFGVIYDNKYLDPEDLLKIDYNSISKFLHLKYLQYDYEFDYCDNFPK
jgi:murein DD-endopeptidase MepM/ murein hydrolase activator NlpD